MHALDDNLFLVKESKGLLKAAYNYDIVEPESGKGILQCREQNMGRLTRLFRFSELRRTTPFDFLVSTTDGGVPVLRVMRGVALFSSKVHVLDEVDDLIGSFSLKPFSISGAFDVLDATGTPVCEIKGNLTGRRFAFLAPDGVELARVTRKWAGAGRELLTGASDYMLQIDEAVPPGSSTRQLILASVLCIGMVLRVET